jgi:ribokinase
VIGSLNADVVVRAPRLPRAGETLLGGPVAVYPGGKGANQAVAAARCGAIVSFVGSVGDDDYGRMLRGALEGEGVEVSALLVRRGVASGVGVVTVSEGGENAIVVAPGANMVLAPADVEAARGAIAAADVLVMQLEVPLEVVARGAEIAREVGTTVALNAAPGRKLPAELLANVDVLVVNETEAGLVCGAGGDGEGEKGESELEVLSKALGRMGAVNSIMTAGARGAWYARGTDIGGRVNAFEVEPIDTVGAGDAFVGVLATRWAEHQVGGGVDALGLLDAVTWASAAGAIVVTRAGAMPSMPRRAEIVALLKR